MLKVELIDYKVSKLDMVNNLGMDESAEISGTSGFTVNFDGDIAVATLTECLEFEGSHNQFHMELELDGYFSIQGITSDVV